MNVARLNFSHGRRDDHQRTIEHLRSVSAERDAPLAILQDLQGPKVRVGHFPGGEILLATGQMVNLLPEADYHGQADGVPLDYPHLAKEAAAGEPILLDDGLLELKVESLAERAVQCRVIEGGLLKSRKGVALPQTALSLPSLTEKDRQDVEFGLALGVDWLALSFVRRAADVLTLRELVQARGANVPILAKIEKPQAVDYLDEILEVVDGLMVARGDLGLELGPEGVPMVQKWIIRAANQRGLPVITATQMLESMIQEPRPTRAEASDVVGRFPVKAVEMLGRIARQVEPHATPANLPPARNDDTHALAQAINAIDRSRPLRCIAAFTTTGTTARLVAAERPQAPIIALTNNPRLYQSLNLHWGVRPVVCPTVRTIDELLAATTARLLEQRLARPGDLILIVAGFPPGRAGGTNFLKLHTV